MRFSEKLLFCAMVKFTRYSFQSLMKLKFTRREFKKIKKIQNFMKIRPVRAESFHAVGQTDMTNLLVTTRNFANSFKNEVNREIHKLFCTSVPVCKA
jgi:hypothetical protein